MLRNVLIAEDDARWLNDIKPDSSFYRYRVVDNVGSALIEIEGDTDWDAAIFDRYLMADNLPFQDGKLCGEAGFILAMAFQRRFPGRRMVIATGSPEAPPINISEVLHPDLCIYVHKESADAAKRVLTFLKGLPDQVRWSERFLKYLVLKPNFCGLGVDLELVLETLARWARNASRSSASDRQTRLMAKEDRFVATPSGDDKGCDVKHPAVPDGGICVVVYDEATGDALIEAEMLEEDLGSQGHAHLRVIAVDSKSALHAVLAGLQASVRRVVIAHIASAEDTPFLKDVFKQLLDQDANAMLAVVSEEAALMRKDTFGQHGIIGIFETPFHYADMLPALVAAMKPLLSK